ncbi:MAG: hypothetical protein HY551_01705 [Elusimicrobia bacterium]|nr:hypothetical protein [Elusimicrobiota bacterium]
MKQRLGMKLRTEQRLAILGRLRMADWIEMPESEFSLEIQKLEKDPLFKKLAFGSSSAPGAILRQRWPRGTLTSGFYEINEQILAKGDRVHVEEKLDKQAHLLPLIRKMGRPDFERYFVHAEEAVPLEEIARRTGLKLEDVQAIHELLLDIGAETEFYLPERDPNMKRSFSCLARIQLSEGQPRFEFFSPYWARGLYQIRYDTLEEWKHGDRLSGAERKRLRHLIKRIETINLRQNTLFRVMESITQLQAQHLQSRSPLDLRPISLRMLAHRLQLAPSTVSRAISHRSIVLPWGKEAPLSALLPGQRRVVREVLARWLEQGTSESDSQLAERLALERGIRISRRTVNAVRNEIRKQR